MAAGNNRAVGITKAYVDAQTGLHTTINNHTHNIYPLTNGGGLTYGGTATNYPYITTATNADLTINGTSMNEMIKLVNQLVERVEELEKLVAVKSVDEESYDVD
jgi:hypothetical protein